MSAVLDPGRYSLKVAFRNTSGTEQVIHVRSVAYIPAKGPILIGEAAIEAGAVDPLGLVDELPGRSMHAAVTRNQRTIKVRELVTTWFDEARRLAIKEGAISLSECVLLHPLAFSQRGLSEWIRTADHAGFSHLKPCPNPLAVVTHYHVQCPIDDNIIAVLDAGRDYKLSLMRRPFLEWRPDWEYGTVAIDPYGVECPDSILPLSRRLLTECQQRGVLSPTLLLVGGAATKALADWLRQEVWSGEVVLMKCTAAAAALGGLPTSSVSGSDRLSLIEDIAPVPRAVLDQAGHLSLSDDDLPVLEGVLAYLQPDRDRGSVRRVTLYGDDWRDQHLKIVCEWLAMTTSCESMQLLALPRISSDGIQWLSHVTSLSVIDVSEWNLRGRAADGLKLLTQLSRLTVLRLPHSLERILSQSGISRYDELAAFLQDVHPQLMIR